MKRPPRRARQDWRRGAAPLSRSPLTDGYRRFPKGTAPSSFVVRDSVLIDADRNAFLGIYWMYPPSPPSPPPRPPVPPLSPPTSSPPKTIDLHIFFSLL